MLLVDVVVYLDSILQFIEYNVECLYCILDFCDI